MCFNVAYYLVNTLLPRSSFCYRISRTPIEEADSLTKIISKNELLNLHGICIAVIIKSNYLYNGCAWIKFFLCCLRNTTQIRSGTVDKSK